MFVNSAVVSLKGALLPGRRGVVLVHGKFKGAEMVMPLKVNISIRRSAVGNRLSFGRRRVSLAGRVIGLCDRNCSRTGEGVGVISGDLLNSLRIVCL